MDQRFCLHIFILGSYWQLHSSEFSYTKFLGRNNLTDIISWDVFSKAEVQPVQYTDKVRGQDLYLRHRCRRFWVCHANDYKPETHLTINTRLWFNNINNSEYLFDNQLCLNNFKNLNLCSYQLSMKIFTNLNHVTAFT